MSKYTVDLIEAEIATLLLRSDETVVKEVPTHQLPPNLKEGDIIEISFAADGTTVLQAAILENDTKQAKQKADALLQKILAKNKKQ
ncbi:DUF3006 domain-containing protein [Desertibacillus haloalkaliphilus]|uniref:DUF3006 domain-containing protein n=1 Tax=Desertibacillus haloalkaliphilus TaxID=1328930 RepID=UPI001C274C56|nr:DUF3006 domain-containing protein [Desertibacillus haloalkaliphilus]MBU8907628.1 DUF3006 domain-containing protein [Desertibacillus haloalkaliphilus]